MSIADCEQETIKYAEIIDKIKTNVTESYDIYNIFGISEKNDKNNIHLESTREINLK